MKKPTKPTIRNVSKPSYIPSVPLELCTRKFKDSIIIPDGANSIVETFVRVMDGLMQTPSFTLDAAITASKPYDLDPQQVKYLFAAYVNVMLSLNKCTVVNGCYDQPTICVV